MQDEPRLDRSAFSVTTLQDQDRLDDAFWHAKSSTERLAAIELSRQILYGYNPATERLRRVLEVIERE